MPVRATPNWPQCWPRPRWRPGANGLFLEIHPNPPKAKSDAACVMPLEWVEPVIRQCQGIFDVVNAS